MENIIKKIFSLFLGFIFTIFNSFGFLINRESVIPIIMYLLIFNFSSFIMILSIYSDSEKYFKNFLPYAIKNKTITIQNIEGLSNFTGLKFLFIISFILTLIIVRFIYLYANMSIENENLRTFIQDINLDNTTNVIKLEMPNHIKDIYFNSKIEDCPICLDEIEEIGDFFLTRCGHHFHKNCIEQSLSGNVKCPICRYEIK